MIEEEKYFRTLCKRIPIFDVSKAYSLFVPFTANNSYPIHRWYRYKEGFSKDLVHLCLSQVMNSDAVCLDPFGGSGTTALACSELNLKCTTIEVNPFVHSVAVSKLGLEYEAKAFDSHLRKLLKVVREVKLVDSDIPGMSTMTRKPHLDKWLFHEDVLNQLLSFRMAIEAVPDPYRGLFLTMLASVSLEVGNTVKDGKCVRYKSGWNSVDRHVQDVSDAFSAAAQVVRTDLSFLEKRAVDRCDNSQRAINASALDALALQLDNAFDAVITSPPYLNSFDYTDVYMPELWLFGHVDSYEDVLELRKRTIRSHVQVRLQEERKKIPREVLLALERISADGRSWNKSIPGMITGYCHDMNTILIELSRVLKPGGKAFIIVGTSSYNGVHLPTDLILASGAEAAGFTIDEIRVVRRFRRSSKQASGSIYESPLRESLIVLTNKIG